MAFPFLALDLGWHFGGLYTVGLGGLGFCLVLGAAAMAGPQRLPVPPSVLYVALGAVAAGALAVLGVSPLDPPVLAGNVGLTGPGGMVLGEPRLSLQTEAGFNDGLASPFVALGLFVVADGGTDWLPTWAAADLLYGAGVGLALGAVSGIVTARTVTREEPWPPTRSSRSRSSASPCCSTGSPRLWGPMGCWRSSRRGSPSGATSSTTMSTTQPIWVPRLRARLSS